MHTAKGCVVADALAFSITLYANGSPAVLAPGGFPGVTMGPVEVWETSRREPFVIEHEAMRDAVRGLPSDIVTLREGARNVAVTEAMLTSARTGEMVPLALAAAP